MTSNLGSEIIREHASKLRIAQKNSAKDESIFFSREFKDNYIYPILKVHIII